VSTVGADSGGLALARGARVVIATGNPGKLAEFQALLAPYGLQAVSSGALGLAEPEETGATFAANAAIKALAASQASGLPAIADDSGICVAALDGAPGLHSARYAGGDYPAAMARILEAAARRGERRARFVCALALAMPDGRTATYIGQADGTIAAAPMGAGGFGYDPLFVPAGETLSYAQLDKAAKNRISHRARAFAQLARGCLPAPG
jgi:XTP/dITP diphosphohydrolase